MAKRIMYPVMAAVTMVGVVFGICDPANARLWSVCLKDFEPSGSALARSKKRGSRRTKPAETSTHAYETQAHAW
jgi:hypothetical protein